MPRSGDRVFRASSSGESFLGARWLTSACAVAGMFVGTAVLAQNAPQAGPAQAQATQNAPAAATGQLETVTVTAQFTSQSVQQTPLAITAINANELAERGQTSILDIARDAPSVNLAPQAAAFGPSMAAYIRGIGQSDLDPALEPGIGIYIDDVYFATITGSIFDLLDLDRVEVLRGPQGTLEGMNSEGGAIKLFSKMPDATETTTFDLLGGSRNHVELRASTNFALTDNLFIRLSGVGNHQDGYENIYDFGCANPTFTATPVSFSPTGLPIYGTPGTYSVSPGLLTKASSCQNGQEGSTAYTGGRAAVRWAPNDSLDVQFIGDLTDVDQEDPAETLMYGGPGPLEGNASATATLITIPATNTVTHAPALIPYNEALVPALVPSNPYTTYTNFCLPAAPIFGTPAYCAQNRQSILNWGGESLINWILGPDVSLRNILAQRGYSSNWAEDNGEQIWPNSLGQEGLEHHQFSEELRLTGKWGSVLDYTVGGFYFRELTVYPAHEDLWYVVPSVPGLFNFLQDDPVLAHDKAGYLHLVWHATSKLDATFGTRYTSQDKTYSYVRVTPQGTPSPLFISPTGTNLNGASGYYSATRWDWRADLAYHFTDEVMVYGQFSTGFKGGGVDPRPFYIQQAVHFNPESLDTYELGLKSTWLDNHLRVNLDGYFSQYRDIQETLGDCNGIEGIVPPFGTPCALPYNAGDAHQKGVELESQLRFGGFQADASISYIDFSYVTLNPATGITLDMITPYLMKWQGNAGAQYTFPLPAGSLTARLDASTRSDVYTSAVNGPYNRIGGYTTYNAHLTWEPSKGNWQIILSGLNLTDKRYWQNIFDLVQVGAGTVDGLPSPPLEIDLEIKHTMM
jgi:iron complex outermembrane recepter protein